MVVTVFSAVRLSGGISAREGKVELLVNGLWKPVCFDQMTDTMAKVVCREVTGREQLNPLAVDKYSVVDRYAHEFVRDVTCRGDETTVSHCSHRHISYPYCNVNQVAAVKCHLYYVTQPVPYFPDAPSGQQTGTIYNPGETIVGKS